MELWCYLALSTRFAYIIASDAKFVQELASLKRINLVLIRNVFVQPTIV